MINTALVAGPSERACDVAAALQAQGFTTITVNDDETVSETCSRVSPRSVDCYVQLPSDAGPAADGSAGANRPGRAQGLLGLVDAVAAVAPLLAEHATVVIMADEGPGGPQRLDRLLDDAVGVLAEAVVADQGGDGVRVSVLGAHESPAEIAAAARGSGRYGSGPSLADFEPDLGYTDWRSQVLSLSSVNDATYFGWNGADGRRPVVSIRGAVLSPLRPLGSASRRASHADAWSWGDSGPGAAWLARTLLADLLGTRALCPACGGAGDGGCPACQGTCLTGSLEGLVPALVDEVVAPLASEGFELPAMALQAWVERHLGAFSPLTDPDGLGEGAVLHRRRRVRRRPRPGPFGARARVTADGSSFSDQVTSGDPGW